MRDNGTPTAIKLGGTTDVYIADKPCTCCGCYEAFVFECNCGEVHSDVCYNCGRFVDIQHETVETMNERIAAKAAGRPMPETFLDTRCTAGATEHRHDGKW